jgi:scyllo-inositol 2-dehydrogenase (NADP+)
MTQPIKTGLIGFGTGGEFFHAPFVDTLPEFELTAVLERTKDKSKEHYPKAKIVRSTEELLSIPGLELVVITTPNETHYDLARQSLEAGKHVVLDKPFTVESEEATDLIELAKKKNRVLTVYHNRRFQSDFLTLQSLIQKGTLGEIKEYRASIERYRPDLRPHLWKENDRPGAGILYDLGSHLIDQALVLFGTPESISADLSITRPGAKVIDHFEVTLHYKNHKAILKAGMLIEKPGPVFKVTGSSGIYTKYGIDGQEALLRQYIRPEGTNWALEKKEDWGQLESEGKISAIESIHTDFRDFYRNLASAIRKGEALAVRPEEAALVIRCIELAMESNVENKAPISL